MVSHLGPATGFEVNPEAVRFVSAVRALRRECGLTQIQLADAIGLTSDAVSKIERTGTGHLRLGTAMRISKFFEQRCGIGMGEMSVPDPEGRW